MKWDGEWQITYETFRDMGIAFAVAMLLIYLLIVGQFQSFVTPLVIMAPIPLTLIGILPGHWLIGSYFTATSMIGFIALSGIIVRNSILLVDFIQLEERAGASLREAVIKAGIIRTRPILLTAAALMVGAFVIILDPIFQGLAVSLLFGVGASTLLTLIVIPVFYYYQPLELPVLRLYSQQAMPSLPNQPRHLLLIGKVVPPISATSNWQREIRKDTNEKRLYLISDHSWSFPILGSRSCGGAKLSTDCGPEDSVRSKGRQDGCCDRVSKGRR